MTNYSHTISNLLTKAQTRKLVERKNGVSDLRSIYENQNAMAEITKNSEENGDLTWNHMLTYLHQLLVDQILRPLSKSDKISTVTSSTCCWLIAETVKIASTPTCVYLKLSNLMTYIIETLDDDIYEICHATYMDLLVNVVLSNRLYRVKMRLEHWQELLRICQKFYDKSIGKEKATILTTLRKVVQHGCRQSDLHQDITTLMPFLVKLFNDVAHNHGDIEEQAYELLCTVIEEIGTECRQSLCEFSENIPRNLILSDGSKAKYKVLLYFVILHHPNGASINDETFYSQNENTWKKIIITIRNLIFKEKKSILLCSSFVSLSVEVFKQIMGGEEIYQDVTLTQNDIEISQRAKRRRVSLNFQTPIDLLNYDLDIKNRWPIIQILTALLIKYPKILQENCFTGFLKIVSDMFDDAVENEDIINSLCQLGSVLLKIEIKYFIESINLPTNRQYWDKIWDILLKILGMNKSEIEGHRLLQLLIKFKGVQNVNAFVNLYFTNAITWSSSSIKTLLVLVENAIISEEIEANSRSEESDKKRILKWILQGNYRDTVTRQTINDICEIVSGLTLKIYTKQNYKNKEINQEDDDYESKSLNVIEKCALAQLFETNLFNKETTSYDNQEKTTMMSSFSDDNLDYVIQLLMNSIDYSQNPIDDKSLVIYKLTIVAKFASNLIELKIEKNDKRLEKLLNSFQVTFTNLWQVIINENILNGSINQVANILRSLIALYELKYHEIVADKILTSTPNETLSMLFTMLNTGIEIVDESNEFEYLGSKYYDNIFERFDVQKNLKDKKNRAHKEISDNSIITIGVHRLLTLFCTFDANKEISNRQIKVLQNLLLIEAYDSNELGNLWKALAILKRVAYSRKNFIPLENLLDVVTFINELLKIWKKDSYAVEGILKIIPQLFNQLSDNETGADDCLQLLKYTESLITRENFGPRSQVIFIKTLNKLMKTISLVSLKFTVLDLIENYLKSPFYIVRIEALPIFHLLFASSTVSIDEKTNLFNKTLRILDTIFEVDGNLEGSRIQDEIYSRSSSAFFMLGCVIHASGVFQSQALNTLIILNETKIKNTKMLEKIIRSIFKNKQDRLNLVENNLYHILESWIEKKLNFLDFPWYLTRSQTENEFFLTYAGLIILIKLEDLNFESIRLLFSNMDVSFEKVIENNFHLILNWLLATMSHQVNGEKNQFATDLYTQLKNNTNDFSNIQVFGDLLDQVLDKILIDLIQRLHDEKHFTKMFDIPASFPGMVVPNYSIEIIERSFHYLKIITTDKKSLIEYLVTRRPNIIQQVMSILVDNIYNQTMFEYKLKAFHHYSYFCQLLINEISDNWFNEMAIFTLREIFYTLIHLIQQDIKPLSEISARFLLLILEKSMQTRFNEISIFLNYIVTNLIPIIQKKNIETAIKILNYLVVDSSEYLSNSIRKLDAFPNELIFNNVRNVWNTLRNSEGCTWNLKDEIEHFLNVFHENNLNCSLEGILHLKNVLLNKREELKQMYKDLEQLRGFAEDCLSSNLHRLIYRLIKLTESPDVSISLEAAQCLGILGPVDLTTMILHPEEGHVQENTDSLTALTLKIITKLADFLIDNCLKLREASAKALYDIYSSAWGNELTRMPQKNLKNYGEIEDIKLLLRYTHPFIPLKTYKLSKKITLSKQGCQRVFYEQNEIWKGEREESYSSWIRNLTCQLFDCFNELFSTSLTNICQLNHEICEIILPRIIFIILETNSKLSTKICTSINCFFEEFYNSTCNLEQTMMLTNPFKKVEKFSHESLRCMLNVVNYLRIQSGDNYESILNYLHISKAAQYCSAYFTSVLYAELASQTLKKELKTSRPDNISIIDYLCETNPKEGKSLQDILREAFVKIGDPDSIHGCGLSHLQDQTSRIQHYIHFKQWDKVLIAQDVELSFGSLFTRGMASTLKNSGLDYLLSKFLTNSKKDNENIDDYIYDTAWRLSDWSIFKRQENSRDNLTSNDYDYHHYQALKCISEKDLIGLDSTIENARLSVINSLRNTSLECSQTVYPILLKLKMLQEIEEFGKSKPDDWPRIITDYHQQDLGNINDFTYIEPILSQRIVMYAIKNQLSVSGDVKEALVNTHLELSRIAEKQCYPHIAARTLESLGRQENLSSEVRDKLNYQEALLSWTRGDQTIARYLMRNLISKADLNTRLKAKGLKIFGDWVAETKSETHDAVINKYYNKSMEIITSIDDKTSDDYDNLNDTFAALAIFADAHYEEISEFMKGPMFKSLQETAMFARDGSYQAPVMSNDRDIRKAMNTNKKQNDNDIAEFEKIQYEQSKYLKNSFENYLKTLIKSEKKDHLIFRLVSLWIKNMAHPEINLLLDKYLPQICSYKFIPLLQQLAPHTSTEKSDFTVKINSLLKRCAIEHPHHVLPVLLCLSNRDKDQEYKDNKTQKKSQQPTDPCVQGAKALIHQLHKSKISKILIELNNVLISLIELAYFTFEQRQGELRIPSKFQITKIRNLQHCIVPTIKINVNPHGNYNNIISVQKYADTFQALGGINAPKKISCIGTDGQRRLLVLKVDSDIKTDAVIQQVFDVMNNLFKTSKETKKRKLNIRTYKVVQLSQKSGVLQWCDNTVPLNSVLVGDKDNPGLHVKYHKNDWTPADCRSRIAACVGQSNEKRLQVYLKCCENLQPAFQYFFLEKFPSPETWFERRLAYVRSCATTSMAGFLLGLGDRHVNNVLVDQTTAELVHIDFGIAFQQGEILPIRETVPFRLTRDIEAPMGVSGVEGVFRRACEETMTVLRNKRETINTLLQVLLYDPLFSWAITPLKAHKMQGDGRSREGNDDNEDTKKVNEVAKKALLRVKEKLLGQDEGLVATSVSGQVERLISQARDPANLALIYHGWNACL